MREKRSRNIDLSDMRENIKQTELSVVISHLGSPLNNYSPFLNGNAESVSACF